MSVLWESNNCIWKFASRRAVQPWKSRYWSGIQNKQGQALASIQHTMLYFVGSARISSKRQPKFQILTWAGDVINNESAYSTSIVCLGNGSIPLLSCGIPYLGLDCSPLNLQITVRIGHRSAHLAVFELRQCLCRATLYQKLISPCFQIIRALLPSTETYLLVFQRIQLGLNMMNTIWHVKGQWAVIATTAHFNLHVAVLLSHWRFNGN